MEEFYFKVKGGFLELCGATRIEELIVNEHSMNLTGDIEKPLLGGGL